MSKEKWNLNRTETEKTGLINLNDSRLEVLKFVVENGMVDIALVQETIEMQKRKELLNNHPYDIWQSDNGYFYTYLPDKEKGRVQKKRKSRKALEDLIVTYYMDNKNISDVFYEWIAQKLEFREIQKQSYDRYISDYERFFINNKNAKVLMEKKFKHIEEDDLEMFIKTTIAEMQLTQKAYSGLRTLLNGIFRYGKKKKYTTLSITNFMGDIDLSRRAFTPKIIDAEKEVYLEDEVIQITEYLRTQKDDLKCLGLLLSFETGMRIGELSALKTSCISDNYIRINCTEIKERDENDKWKVFVKEYAKTSAGNRNIVIPDRAKETIADILKITDSSEFLFSSNGKRIRSNCFRRKLMVICNRLKIPYRPNHKIRKTYGTTLIDNGVDDAIIAEQMGHTDIATTRKFYYYSNKTKEKTQEQVKRAISF